MAKDAKQFVQDARNDRALREQILGGQALHEVDLSKVVAVANANGYAATEASIKQAVEALMVQDGFELSEEELDLVSGGGHHDPIAPPPQPNC